ncbi:retinol dehydrogenase-14 [Marmoricola sp. OAE513]|uniref:SDR family NAD(P)-dependent oxidoreductase n=1 Tax=Marmoricola sp. OAE513 TaxID=2817894 RepID=UPI001AE320FB
MKTIVITGASDGIGLESASQLAAQGHHLVLVGRSPTKLAAAVQRIATESPQVKVDSFTADFASLADVRRLAGELLAAYPRIDVLVNNAGTVYDKRELTVDGYEATFAVNHLAGFLLTELLLDRLVASGTARIVNTASGGHYRGTMDLDDLGFERGYQIMRAYSRSKLANVLYTRNLAARLGGTGVTANCLHPGAVATNIWAGAPAFARPALSIAKRLLMITPAEGGATLTYLATNEEVAGLSGGYYEKNRLTEPAELALDEELGRRLVAVSREMVAV